MSMPNFSTTSTADPISTPAPAKANPFKPRQVSPPPGLEVDALATDHRGHLLSEGLTEAQINQLVSWGVRSISEIEATELGFSVTDESRGNTKGRVSSSGILFPFTPNFAQLRCDTPPIRKGRPAKYLTQCGRACQAWVPDGARVITEGFKDAAAGTLIGGIPTSAVAGVSHVRKAVPKGCKLNILFDFDAWTNPNVFAALVTAAEHTGGKIQIVPEIEGHPKAGLCEYFKAGHTSDDYAKLVSSGYTIKQFLIELPKHWVGADSSKFARLLRTAFSLAQNYLSGTELEQLAGLCKTAGKAHHVAAPAIRAELKRVQAIRTKRAKANRAKANRKNFDGSLDLTNFGISRDQCGPDDEPPQLLLALGCMNEAMAENLRLNRLTGQIEYKGGPIDPNHYQTFVTGFINADIPESQAVQILSLIASKYSYHPAQEWFESIAEEYGRSTIRLLDQPATRLLKTSNPLYDVFLRKVLAAIVKRVYEPGCKWDYILLLQGQQGLRKSTFWAELMPDPSWFDDNLSGDINNKDQLALLSRCVLQEWGEFDRITSTREASDLKAFVVRKNDVYRAPYERASTDHPRQSVIVGSVNKAEFLTDETGDRRYWVAEIEEQIDVDLLIAEREQLWAAAVAAYKAGEELYLCAEDEAASTENNLAYRVQDPWLQPITDWLADKANLLVSSAGGMNDWVTSATILTGCLSIETKAIRQYDRTRVEKVLKALGWSKQKKQIRLSGHPNPVSSAWFRPIEIPATPPPPTESIAAPEPEQPEPSNQQLPLGEWPVPPAPTKPQWQPTHTVDGVEVEIVRYLGDAKTFAICKPAQGPLMPKVAASSLVSMGVAAA
jgi:predicted P-loop ATPase